MGRSRGYGDDLGHVAFALLGDLEGAAFDRLVQQQERLARLALEHERADLERAERLRRAQDDPAEPARPFAPRSNSCRGGSRLGGAGGFCILMWTSTLLRLNGYAGGNKVVPLRAGVWRFGRWGTSRLLNIVTACQ